MTKPYSNNTNGKIILSNLIVMNIEDGKVIENCCFVWERIDV